MPVTNGRVLVIEDEFGVGLDIQSTLSRAGFEVVGPIMTVEEAIRTAEQGGFAAAIIDANLNGQHAGGVAAVLIERSIPILVVSGYAREFLPFALSHAPLLSKPFDGARLVEAVRRLCQD